MNLSSLLTEHTPFSNPLFFIYIYSFYLKRLMGWCEELGLKVLIDLHAAPGSQNGFDNSGKRGPIDWFNPDDHSNIDRTLTALDIAAELMASWIEEGIHDVVAIFQSSTLGIK